MSYFVYFVIVFIAEELAELALKKADILAQKYGKLNYHMGSKCKRLTIIYCKQLIIVKTIVSIWKTLILEIVIHFFCSQPYLQTYHHSRCRFSRRFNHCFDCCFGTPSKKRFEEQLVKCSFKD